MDISFIIPVYNGEGCMKRCIASIRKWNWGPDIEILIIDDGSTDDTAVLCRRYMTYDDRISFFSIENSGQSVARNYGMMQCRGKYIYFVDADDEVNAKEVFRMWEIAEREEADVVMGAYFRVYGTKKERIHLAGEGRMARKGRPKEEILYRQIKTESAFGYVWNKLYKRDFLEKNNLVMDDVCKIYMEDQLFNIKVWSKKPVWYCYDGPVYYYEAGNVSTTRKAQPQIHRKNICMINALTAYYDENNNLEENLDVLLPLLLRTFCWSLVKNIPYEGNRMTLTRKRAKAYMGSETVQRLIGMPGAVRELWKLPSLLQAVFYSLCLVLIRWKWSGVTAFLFHISYPVMKKYILKVVK